MIKKFDGKVVVITGAASGIGRSLAHAFAKRGMKIVLVDIDKESLKKVAQELKEIGAEVMIAVTDVSDRQQVANLAEKSYERFGNVDILCNNAGVAHSGPMHLLSLEDWDWVLGVNMFGVIYGIHFFLKRMLKSDKPCHIVNTSSMAGLLSSSIPPYSTSKHAVVAISEDISAKLVYSNVSVSVICPSFVRTNIVKNTEKFVKQHPRVFQLAPEMAKKFNIDREAFKKNFEVGMDPDILAEKVIKAIEEDIFYVIPSPEVLPYVQNRFERMQEDSLKLNKE